MPRPLRGNCNRQRKNKFNKIGNKERGGCDTFAKWRNLKIRAVIKYFCKKRMPPKQIHADFMETLGKKSTSYSTVNIGQQSLKGGERALRMMDGLAAPKMPPLMKMSRSYTPWLCVIGGETCKA